MTSVQRRGYQRLDGLKKRRNAIHMSGTERLLDISDDGSSSKRSSFSQLRRSFGQLCKRCAKWLSKSKPKSKPKSKLKPKSKAKAFPALSEQAFVSSIRASVAVVLDPVRSGVERAGMKNCSQNASDYQRATLDVLVDMQQDFLARGFEEDAAILKSVITDIGLLSPANITTPKAFSEFSENILVKCKAHGIKIKPDTINQRKMAIQQARQAAADTADLPPCAPGKPYEFGSADGPRHFRLENLGHADSRSLQRNSFSALSFFRRTSSLRSELGVVSRLTVKTIAMTTAYGINEKYVSVGPSGKLEKGTKAYRAHVRSKIQDVETLLSKDGGLMQRAESFGKDSAVYKKLEALQQRLQGFSAQVDAGVDVSKKEIADTLREVVTINRAMEMVEQSIADGKTTISLTRIVTPDSVRHSSLLRGDVSINGNDEKQMLIEEHAALKLFDGIFVGEGAKPLRLLHFNFSVNRMALVPGANSEAHQMNLESFTALKEIAKEKLADPSVSKKDKLKMQYLLENLKNRMTSSGGSDDDPLLVAKEVLLLGQLCDVDIHAGCKSAKDRTGHLLSEAILHNQKLDEALSRFAEDNPDVDELDGAQFKTLQKSMATFTRKDAMKLWLIHADGGAREHAIWSQGFGGTKSGNVLGGAWTRLSKMVTGAPKEKRHGRLFVIHSYLQKNSMESLLHIMPGLSKHRDVLLALASRPGPPFETAGYDEFLAAQDSASLLSTLDGEEYGKSMIRGLFKGDASLGA